MSAHIIGRPDDHVVEILLGPGADPEQAFIAGRKQGLVEDDGVEDDLPGDDSTSRER